MPTHTRPPTPHLSHPRRSPSSQAEGAGPAPKEDHHKVQSHFNGPISRRSPSSPRCGCRACPKGGPPQGAVPLQRPNPPPGPNPQAKAAGRLVSLCRFPAIFRPGPRPPFGSRPARYDLSPFFDRFNTPQRGPRPLIQAMPGRYDLSPFVDLSVAPQSQAAPRLFQARAGRKNAHTLFRSNQIAPCPAGDAARLTPTGSAATLPRTYRPNAVKGSSSGTP